MHTALQIGSRDNGVAPSRPWTGLAFLAKVRSRPPYRHKGIVYTPAEVKEAWVSSLDEVFHRFAKGPAPVTATVFPNHSRTRDPIRADKARNARGGSRGRYPLQPN